MKQIWKYQLNPGTRIIEMPFDAEILAVQVQKGIPYMWAMVKPDNHKVNREFMLIGTNHDIDEKEEQYLVYIGTFQVDNGDHVFHIFEKF